MLTTSQGLLEDLHGFSNFSDQVPGETRRMQGGGGGNLQ